MQGNLHVWFWPGFPEVSNNLASARRWRTSPNYCPFPTKVEKKDSKDRKYVIFIDSGVGISVHRDHKAPYTIPYTCRVEGG